MPRRSSWVDIGGYTAWSLPSTAWPSSRASAATPPMKVPAMPRICSFKASGPVERRPAAVDDLVDRADAVHHAEPARIAVVADHRRGLLVVALQALADRLGLVVGTALGLCAAGQAVDQQLVVDFQLDRGVHRLADALEQRVERGRLGQVAWIAVEDEAIGHVVAGEPVLEHAEQDRVGHQLAAG